MDKCGRTDCSYFRVILSIQEVKYAPLMCLRCIWFKTRYLDNYQRRVK